MRPSDRSRALLLAAVVLATGACAARPPVFDAAAESAALLKRDAEWADVASAGKDVDRIVSYWSDDAVIMQAGQAPVEGKQAIRAFITSTTKIPGFKIHWVSEKPAFSPDGQLAYMRGKTEMTVPGPTGQPMPLHLQGVTVWRKDADGVWRCTVDIGVERAPDVASRS